MKKMILLGAAAIMMAFSASAQMSLVKDLAKKAASGNPQARGTPPVKLPSVCMTSCTR